jgi:predicted dehydrogenase
MRARVGIGVIGLGHLGRFHAEILAGRVPTAELAGVVDVAEETAKAVGETLDVGWSTDFDLLLDDPAVRGVVIATPPSLHPQMISQAAQAGKHILCEKPISLDVTSGAAAIAAAQAGGVNLQVGFHRRFEPDWQEVVERMRAGDLGDVYLWRSSHRDPVAPTDTSYVDSMGTLLEEMMIHDIDCALWMVGEISEVTAVGASVVSPIFEEAGDLDHVIIGLRFQSGALGLVDGSRAAGYGHECFTEVLGSKATARLGDGRQDKLEWLTPGRSTRKQIVDYRIRHLVAYTREHEDFVSSIVDERPPTVTGEDALAAFIIGQTAVTAYRERRSIVVDALKTLREATTAS